MLLESESDDSDVECSHHQGGPVGTVKLITATQVPARHTKIMKARIDGVGPRSTALLDPGGELEQRGLLCEERLVAAVGSTPPQSSTKGGDCSLESLQRDNPKLIPYFSCLEDGILPDDENESRELVLFRSQFEVIDGILYHVEKDKALCVIPLESV